MHKRQQDVLGQAAHAAGVITDIVGAIETKSNGGFYATTGRNGPYARELSEVDYRYDTVSTMSVERGCASKPQNTATYQPRH